MSFKIKLQRTVTGELASDIEKESCFVSPHLSRLKVIESGKAVEVEVADQQDDGEVREKVERFLEVMLKRVHKFENMIYFRGERSDRGPITVDAEAELSRRRWLFDYGEGQVALAGPALALAQMIDAKAAELYQRSFSPVGGMFPAFINSEMLARCGYFENHPNAVTMVAHLVEDFDVIENFRKGNYGSDASKLPHKEHLHLPGLCLNPAACFPCYPTLSGQKLPPSGHSVSWQGRVFRYESRNISGLERLWEFNVRELVFFGSSETVEECRRAGVEAIGELAAFFDLDVRIETANDPFFATVAAAKTFFQRTQQVKSEIRMPVGPGKGGQPHMIACGSVNVHGDYFGTRFDIGLEGGGAAHSGCIGLGIERLVLAAFAQHDFDPDRWPGPVRKVLFG